MKVSLLSLKDLLWKKYHYTEWVDGGESTCEVMDEESFVALLQEIDMWIGEEYGA